MLMQLVRASPAIRNEFAKSLPHEILSELVVIMSDPSSTPALKALASNQTAPQVLPFIQPAIQPAHQDLELAPKSNKRRRKSEAHINLTANDTPDVKPPAKKQARRSEPSARRITNAKHHDRAATANTTTTTTQSTTAEPISLTPERELAYCRDLIHRMLSGPGYWTRLVGPFRNPVDPEVQQMPNYFNVVKRPMDLKTIKGKMDRNEYSTSQEFEADVKQIFQNCYEYWTENDQVFKDCEAFERYFNRQWSERHKWAPAVKYEVVD